MKYLFILCLVPFLAFAANPTIEITKEVDFVLTPDQNEIFVVEKAYADLFNQKVFIKEMTEVLNIIANNKNKQKLEINVAKYNQKFFIERYLKKEKYDAFLYNDSTLIVYTK